jgi:type I restriction enzyme, S subunit
MRHDWKYKTLGDAVTRGSSNISLNKIKDDEGDYPVFGAKGLIKNISFFQQEQEYLAIIKDGAGIGRVSYHPKKSSVLATMQYLIPKEGIDIDFVEYFLNSIDFEKHRNGSTIPHIYFKDYKNEPFPALPLPEQKRIVAILDGAFEGINRALANAEKNRANVRELFKSYLNKVFTEKSGGWDKKPLGEICSLITDGKHGNCQNEENSGYYFLSAKDVKHGTLNFDNARQITKSDFEETHRRTNLEPHDICMVNTGATIGKLALAPDDDRTRRTTFQKSVAIIKTLPIIDNAFCSYHLRADLTNLVNVSSGSAQKNLLIGDLKRYLISFPPLDRQKSIAKNLNKLSTETQRLESIYQRKLIALTELKQSLLQKAFSGELTADDTTTKEEAVA